MIDKILFFVFILCVIIGQTVASLLTRMQDSSQIGLTRIKTTEANFLWILEDGKEYLTGEYYYSPLFEVNLDGQKALFSMNFKVTDTGDKFYISYERTSDLKEITLSAKIGLLDDDGNMKRSAKHHRSTIARGTEMSMGYLASKTVLLDMLTKQNNLYYLMQLFVDHPLNTSIVSANEFGFEKRDKVGETVETYGERLLRSKDTCDVVFLFNQTDMTDAIDLGRPLVKNVTCAHKVVLATRAPELLNLLEDQKSKNEIHMSDMSFKAFEELLGFVYTTSVPENIDDNVQELLLASKRYKLDRLQKYCEEVIMENLKANNVLTMFDLAEKEDLKRLRGMIVDHLKRKGKKNEEWSLVLEQMEKSICLE